MAASGALNFGLASSCALYMTHGANTVITIEPISPVAGNGNDSIISAKMVPTKIDSVYYVIGDRYIVFAGNGNNEKWRPDVIVNRKGGYYSTEEVRIDAQDEENELWRNVLACRKERRLICVDRFYVRNKYIGMIYIIQADRKKLPFGGTCHWNVNNPSYIELVGKILTHYKQLSLNAWNNNK